MSSNDITIIPGESAFIYENERYEVVEKASDKQVGQVAQRLVQTQNQDKVYQLDAQKSRFKYQGQWFKISSNISGSLAKKPDAHGLMEGIANAFILGIAATEADVSQVVKATLHLTKGAKEGHLEYFRAGNNGLVAKTASWDYEATQHATEIALILHSKADYLDVDKSRPKGSTDHVNNVYGFKNGGNTCFAGAALTELRAMYAEDEEMPEIYSSEQSVLGSSVVDFIKKNWKSNYKPAEQEDCTEFRDALLKKSDIRMPVNIFKHYLAARDQKKALERLVGALIEHEGDTKEVVEVRAALYLLFFDPERSNEKVEAFINASNALIKKEKEEDISSYIQDVKNEYSDMNIPDAPENWDTVDHLAFALYKLGIKDEFPSPYGDLSHLSYTLKPQKYKSDNTLQELIDSSGISGDFEVSEFEPPEFIPITISRFDDSGNKTPNPVLLSLEVEIGDTNYELRGFTRHIGPSAKSGHYIGYTLTEDNRWIECNDDKVREVNFEEIQRLAKNTVRTLLLRRVVSD